MVAGTEQGTGQGAESSRWSPTSQTGKLRQRSHGAFKQLNHEYVRKPASRLPASRWSPPEHMSLETGAPGRSGTGHLFFPGSEPRSRGVTSTPRALPLQEPWGP